MCLTRRPSLLVRYPCSVLLFGFPTPSARRMASPVRRLHAGTLSSSFKFDSIALGTDFFVDSYTARWSQLLLCRLLCRHYCRI
jgi:hypothetical protein